MKYRNLYINKLEPFDIIIPIKDASGNPVNLTGYEGQMKFAKHYESSTKYNVEVSVQNASEGLIRCFMNGEDTQILPTAIMVYSLFIISPTDVYTLYQQGEVVVNPTI